MRLVFEETKLLRVYPFEFHQSKQKKLSPIPSYHSYFITDEHTVTEMSPILDDTIAYKFLRVFTAKLFTKDSISVILLVKMLVRCCLRVNIDR